ncbi:MAG: endolytic transglycosylase MltG [Gammaproteobacteria bacterium]
MVAGGAVTLVRYADTRIEVPQKRVVVTVERGKTLRQVAAELHRRGIIAKPLLWRLLARLQGKSGQIKAGDYAIETGMTPQLILDHLVSGISVQYSLTIPEGWTYHELMTAVEHDPNLKHTLNPDDLKGLLARLGGPAQDNPEGWFYPDTYFFPRGTTDVEFLKRGYDMMKRRLDKEWAERSQGLPIKTPYQALILASIVEKETGAKEERPMIAAVFVNRLEKGMRLQSDPTVIYGMGSKYDGNIRVSDLEHDTPYNTYTRKGLPPTPIALPSGDAIHAVLHPAHSNALYFVAMGGGRHYFSDTYAEHKKAVIKYLLGGNASRYQGH